MGSPSHRDASSLQTARASATACASAAGIRGRPASNQPFEPWAPWQSDRKCQCQCQCLCLWEKRESDVWQWTVNSCQWFELESQPFISGKCQAFALSSLPDTETGTD